MESGNFSASLWRSACSSLNWRAEIFLDCYTNCASMFANSFAIKFPMMRGEIFHQRKATVDDAQLWHRRPIKGHRVSVQAKASPFFFATIRRGTLRGALPHPRRRILPKRKLLPEKTFTIQAKSLLRNIRRIFHLLPLPNCYAVLAPFFRCSNLSPLVARSTAHPNEYLLFFYCNLLNNLSVQVGAIAQRVCLIRVSVVFAQEKLFTSNFYYSWGLRKCCRALRVKVPRRDFSENIFEW